MLKASQNKYLILKPGVVLTPSTEPVIVRLEPFFQAAGLRARVTRALADAYGQLGVVKQYVKKLGLENMFPEAMACTNPSEEKNGQYVWQMAWSYLLSQRVIINPPLAAVCLLDYFGPNGKGPNRRGRVINQTPHARGNCFDIGGAGGDDATIADELRVIEAAVKKGVPGLLNYLPEHNNNCIHIDCKKV